jgi:hypothetical protein
MRRRSKIKGAASVTLYTTTAALVGTSELVAGEELVGPEDLIRRIADSLPGPGGDLPRLVANQLAALEHDHEARHAEAVRWVFRLAATHRRYLARAAGMRNSRRVLNYFKLKVMVDAETYLEAHGDPKPSGRRIQEEMERRGVYLEMEAINRRRRRLRHNQTRS